MVVGVIFGLVPIIKLRGMDLAQVLRDGARGLSGGSGRRRGREALVVAEMALATLLLTGATLTIRSFRNLQQVDAGFDASNVLTFRLSLPPSRHCRRLNTSGFAVLALVLAAVGIYGVVSSAVSEQTREIGIRLALGAGAGSVRGWVLRTSLAPAGIGLALGLGMAALLAGFLRSILFGVAPLDPLTFGAVGPLLALVAVGSILIPAFRASRVEPIEALRSE